MVSQAVTAEVYAVHFKSNYGATTEESRLLNRVKRTHAAEELVKASAGSRYVIVAGDFNADQWRKEFSEERLFDVFSGAGFVNLMASLPPGCRGTHPHRRYGDSCLDYVVTRGFLSIGMPFVHPNEELSDHFAVFAVIDRI